MTKISYSTRSAAARFALMTSAATLSLTVSGVAQAQSADPKPVSSGNGGYVLEAQNGVAPAPVTDPSIVIAPPGTSVTDRDPTNVTGVGQMIIDQKNGFIGLCTGTLINPRTVIFAAHCVNESPAGAAMNPWGYGTGTGQLPIAFGFASNNNLAGNSAFGHWLNGTAGGAKYLTSIADFLYNVNQVQYNSHSLDLGLANNFLQADIAVASLDTPAANVPTWALLFSALPAPSSINDTTGTGYHVVLDGYGNTGTATSGSNVGVDYRRRLAENYLGLLGSLNDIDINLFGIAPRGRPQNLYQIDFDSSGAPNARTSGFDFNIFKDNALTGEGITGPGDSGGPLILDRTYAKQLVIAVLSGGTRYFGAQPSGSYGTSAFYQPLYLYWDYIAAANPYRYVGSVAGDGNWTDPTHWVTNVDPAYNVIVNGQLVNGVPTTLGDGVNGTAGKFGQICDQEPNFAYDVCVDNKNGNVYDHGVLVGTTGYVPSAPGNTALPVATLANGLPGATNFVPNNINPNATTQTSARYFDVTLGAAGTTTLGSTVTIDRLTINNTAAKLTVNSGAALTSLININQLQGLVTNNGTITSVGDYMLLTGGITGAGRFNAPFFTSVSGMIMPGTAGTTNTITFGGNLILSSGTVQFIDLGANGASDKLAVVANGSSTGVASIGGVIGFAPVAGYTIKAGDIYTILTAAGGVSGSYTAAGAFSAILSPTFLYTTNAVQVVVTPGKYADVVSGTSPVQKAYAQLLDQDRGGGAPGLPEIYLGLDLQNAATIQAQLEALAPRNQTLSDGLATTTVDNMSRFYRDRLAGLHAGSLGGKLTMIGKPFQMASLAINGLQGQAEVRTDAGGEVHSQARLPESMSGYLAGGYINGHSRPMLTAIPAGGRDSFDGFFIAGGIEKEVSPYAVVGVSLSYSKLDGVTVNAPQTARTELIQGSIYAKVETPGKIALDAIMSAGSLKANTVRLVSVLGTPYTLTGNNSMPAISGEIGLGKIFDAGKLTITPRIAARGSHIDLSSFAESGGGPALRYARTSLDSLQGRAGITLSGGTSIKPQLSGYFVHEFTKQALSVGANFVGANGPNAIFSLGGRDRDWAEISGGLTITTGKVDLSVSADTTISRDDAYNQSYRGSIAFHF
ncbi:autotransporter domain-containing protein [Sphingomonas sp. RT2P30]|uniref:autotransporter domain-containing protein n=1 Tax=Parasphingomonas halimpatiens TaxID=3096162 RepID=UPI002FC7C9D6